MSKKKSNLSLIIQREFKAKVQKRSFIIMTLLTPILVILFLAATAFLAYQSFDEKNIVKVYDPQNKMADQLYSDGNLVIHKLDSTVKLEQAKASIDTSGSGYSLLIIPPNVSWDSIQNHIDLYSKSSPSSIIMSKLEDQLNLLITKERLNLRNLDPKIIEETQADVNLRLINKKEEDVTLQTDIAKGVAFVSFFAMYFFVLVYGAQVMRSVMEEKTSRVVEIILSTVKPKQLMFGKILGSALVSFVQFSIWIIMIGIGMSILQFFVGNMAAISGAENLSSASNPNELSEVFKSIYSLPIGTIVFSFLFYFLFGFLSFSALFAAIGSIVDNQTDSQQFMFPLMIPMMLSLYASFGIVENPESSVAFWLSIIPITSPIAMMARIPFGVPLWELLLSMGLLISFFFGVVALSAKLYRIGILYSRSKPSYAQVWKWLRS